MKDGKVVCTNCNYDKVDYQDIREVKEKSIKASFMSIFGGNYKIKILKAIYHCPRCDAVSAYPVKEGIF